MVTGSEVTAAFRQAMAEAGVRTDEEIIADGELHRVHVEGDRQYRRNAWYVLHPDEPAAGAFGCWKRGISATWCAEAPDDLSSDERAQWRERIERRRRERERKQRQKRERARQKARRLWRKAGPADPAHAYLAEKDVEPHRIRQLGDTLLVPVYGPSGSMRGLQRIRPDGAKRFLAGTDVSGSYFPLGGKPDGTLVVAEGFSTAATIHEATGHAVAVAFNAGNLRPVATRLREELDPELRFIIAADNDRTTDGNPGLTKATEAARQADALLAVPEFENGEKGSDFNDLAACRGPDAVVEAIRAAAPPPSETMDALQTAANAMKPGPTDGWTWRRDGLRLDVAEATKRQGAIRAVVTARNGDELAYRDMVNLTSGRERAKFRSRLEEAGVELNEASLLELEDQIRRDLLPDDSEDEERGESDPISGEVQESAEELLRAGNILDRAVATMHRRGLVAEDTNARVLFLSGVGGVLGAPIHLIVHGGSSAGKNTLANRALELLPPRYTLAVSGLSEHALEYRGGRIEGVLLVDEAEGQGQAEYGLRVAMSEGRITRLTVNKSEEGRNEAESLEVEVAASVITTTTAPALHAENQTRVFDLHADESEGVTQGVLARRAREAAGAAEAADEVELVTWRQAIESLEPAPVVIPWAERLADEFPTAEVRARRDFPRVLALVEACTLLHQKRRPRDADGRLIATREDWRIVRPLVQRTVGASMSGLSETAIQLAELHDELVSGQSGEWLRRVDLEDEAGARGIASPNTVHKWARRLTELGIWEGRRDGVAWEHRARRDAKKEPVPLPDPQDLPEEPPNTPQNGGGRDSSRSYAGPELPPKPPKSGGGRRLDRSDKGPELPPSGTGEPHTQRVNTPAENSADPNWEIAENPRDRGKNSSQPPESEGDPPESDSTDEDGESVVEVLI